MYNRRAAPFSSLLFDSGCGFPFACLTASTFILFVDCCRIADYSFVLFIYDYFEWSFLTLFTFIHFHKFVLFTHKFNYSCQGFQIFPYSYPFPFIFYISIRSVFQKEFNNLILSYNERKNIWAEGIIQLNLISSLKV